MLRNRRTKIVATIGPATQDEIHLRKMIEAGMDVARLNFSHGTHELHKQTYHRIREISKQMGKSVCIMQDLQGVKIRTGEIFMTIYPGDTVTLTTDTPLDDTHIFVDFPDMHRYIKPGNTILLDDGNLELKAIAVEGREIICKVITGGEVRPNKGVNLPGITLDIPGFTDKDEQDLRFGLSLGVDAVAVSFVTSAEDISRVKRAISQVKNNTCSPILIAKMERPEALDNLEEIVRISDGVMVARGDLGVEMPPQEVPSIQKEIIQTANQYKKIVITATQMLESMIHNSRPTRAETTDVANAIFDGSDAVMLSGETAVGDYPIETIEMMEAIICESEKHLKEWGRWKGTQSTAFVDDAEAIAAAARELAHDLNVSAVVVFTQSGRTARIMSKEMPRVPILGFTPVEDTYNKMAIFRGVYPYMIQEANSLEEMLTSVDEAMVTSTPIKSGQQVVVVCGFPVGGYKLPNLALLHQIGTS